MSDNDFLQHYGVPNMKWGVWNAETQRKYAGGSGRRAKRVVRTDLKLKQRIGSVAKKPVNAVVSKYRNRKEEKRIAKEQGIKRGQMKAFKALRKETLRAHDPETVAKGMHTLTDSELTAKIVRLEQEKKVVDLSNAKKQASLENARKAEEVKKAKKERRASGMAAQLVKSTYNATINYAGKKAVDGLFDKTGAKDAIDAVKDVVDDTPKGKKWKVKTPWTVEQESAVDAGKSVAAEVLNVETIVPVEKRLPSGRG